jgi:hypothetical protein
MNKVLAFAAVLAGLGVLARLSGPKMGNIDWEKRFEVMPGNAPPKWMFRNITAIRENTAFAHRRRQYPVGSGLGRNRVAALSLPGSARQFRDPAAARDLRGTREFKDGLLIVFA